jgi:hypothetical protein
VEAVDALLSNPIGKTARGRRKTLSGPRASAKTLFAARFSELWKYFRGKEPGPQEGPAAEAVQAYWMACGGKRHVGTSPVTSWRKHFEYVRKNRATASVVLVRDRCKLAIDQAVKRGRAPWSVPN